METNTLCFKNFANISICLNVTKALDNRVQSPLNPFSNILNVLKGIRPFSNKTNNNTKGSINRLTNILRVIETAVKVAGKVLDIFHNLEITPTWKLHHLHILMAITAALIVILNTYVISLFVRKKNLRKKSNLFLLSLTVSDELIGLIVIPFFITGQMIQGTKKVETWPIAQRYSHISYIFLTFCSLLCISNLCAVTLDRCFHLCSPLKYQQKLTKAKVVTALGIIWACCSVFAVSSFLYYYPIYQYQVKKTGVFEIRSMTNMMKKTKESNYIDILALYSISLALSVVITILLIKIFIVIVRRRHTSKTYNQRAKRCQEVKSAIILSVMFGTLIVWLTPVFYYFLGQETLENSIGMYLGRFVISVVNPILFTLFKTDFWKIAKEDKMKFIQILQAIKKKLVEMFGGIQKMRAVRSENEYYLSSMNEKTNKEFKDVTITSIVRHT